MWLQGKKKLLHQEALPSPQARRVAPTISDDLRKKIQTAIKTKENKGKRGVKKENIAEVWFLFISRCLYIILLLSDIRRKRMNLMPCFQVLKH